MKKTIRLGIIGTGGMAGAHASRFQAIKGVKLVACCDIIPERARQFAAQWNIPAVYTDYELMLDKEQLDGISNVTPDAVHKEVVLAAARRKIHILCEKPLATNLADAKAMYEAVRKAGVINVVNFSYRDSPGLQGAARAVAAGKIGRVLHVEASYLQSWLSARYWGDWRKETTWLWRLSLAHGSLGVLGDVGCHIYDMTTFVCGDIAEIYCNLQTFKKNVPGERIGEYKLDANDSFVSAVTFQNGAIGTIHSTRWATGHKNSLRLRVYGDKGAVEIDLDRARDEYRIVTGQKNVDQAIWHTVKCKPTPNNYQRFITSIRTGKNDVSDFANGVKIQAYLHYSFVSDKLRKPVKVVL